jgi:TetR/AcrR family transcriptional repressor of nem operon
MSFMSAVRSPHESKTRILDAAMRVIRAKGYSATTIDDVCLAAGLTKGSFFHHFKSKEDLALAAAAHFSAMAESLFSVAPYRKLSDPLDRLLGYVDLRRDILAGDLADYTCLLGTMVQEAYGTHPAIREACDRYITLHANDVSKDIAAAKALYVPDADWSAESLGLFTQATLQGAFILAKARNGPEIAVQCVSHLRRYLELLFNQSKQGE